MSRPTDKELVADIVNKSILQAQALGLDKFYLFVASKNAISPGMMEHLQTELRRANIKHALVRVNGNVADAITVLDIKVPDKEVETPKAETDETRP